MTGRDRTHLLAPPASGRLPFVECGFAVAPGPAMPDVIAAGTVQAGQDCASTARASLNAAKGKPVLLQGPVHISGWQLPAGLSEVAPGPCNESPDPYHFWRVEPDNRICSWKRVFQKAWTTFDDPSIGLDDGRKVSVDFGPWPLLPVAGQLDSIERYQRDLRPNCTEPRCKRAFARAVQPGDDQSLHVGSITRSRLMPFELAIWSEVNAFQRHRSRDDCKQDFCFRSSRTGQPSATRIAAMHWASWITVLGHPTYARKGEGDDSRIRYPQRRHARDHACPA